MREILFRGKRVDNGEWVYGSYWCSRRSNTYQHSVFDDGVWVSVDPSTVGQFTGLTDHNGVKIFEGDIVKYFDDWIGKVEYDSDSALFAVSFVDGDYDYFGRVACGDCEVIGNIYDNPELLDGGGQEWVNT